MATPRAVLTEAQAIEIYMLGQKIRKSCFHLRNDDSVVLARKFCVSPKTIRDIWNRRTWTKETKYLWNENERPMIRKKKFVALCGSSSKTNAGIHGSKELRSPYHHFPTIGHEGEETSTPFIQFPAQHVSKLDHPSFQTLPFFEVACRGVGSSAEPATRPPLLSLTLQRPRTDTDTNAANFPVPTQLLSAWEPGGGAWDSPCGGGQAMDFAAAALDDPFHSDWPHW